MAKFLQILTALFLFFIISSQSLLLAQNSLTVTIRVGLVNLTLSGKTSPQAQVTIMEQEVVVGTTTADSNGSFSKTLTGLEEGVYQISLYASDIENETTSTIVYSIALTAGTDTALGNIILPSTIFLSDEEIVKGDNLKISGYGVPSSNMTIFINNTDNTLTETAIVGIDGYWEYDFNTSELDEGDRSLYVKISTIEGYQSEASKTMNFKIQPIPTPVSTSGTAETSVSTSTPSPTSISSPIPVFLAKLPGFLKSFDIDGSGRIELREIFSSVKVWVQSWRDPEDYNCDLNSNGVCNVIDFSILLYYIGR